MTARRPDDPIAAVAGGSIPTPPARYWPRRPDFDDVACGLTAGRDAGARGAFGSEGCAFGAPDFCVG